MTNTTDKLREMSTNEHVKVLEQMLASGFDYDFDNEQYAALDAAIAALKAEKPQVDEAMVGRAYAAWREAAANRLGNREAIRVALNSALAAQESANG